MVSDMGDTDSESLISDEVKTRAEPSWSELVETLAAHFENNDRQDDDQHHANADDGPRGAMDYRIGSTSLWISVDSVRASSVPDLFRRTVVSPATGKRPRARRAVYERF